LSSVQPAADVSQKTIYGFIGLVMADNGREEFRRQRHDMGAGQPRLFHV